MCLDMIHVLVLRLYQSLPNCQMTDFRRGHRTRLHESPVVFFVRGLVLSSGVVPSVFNGEHAACRHVSRLDLHVPMSSFATSMAAKTLGGGKLSPVVASFL